MSHIVSTANSSNVSNIVRTPEKAAAQKQKRPRKPLRSPTPVAEADPKGNIVWTAPLLELLFSTVSEKQPFASNYNIERSNRWKEVNDKFFNQDITRDLRNKFYNSEDPKNHTRIKDKFLKEFKKKCKKNGWGNIYGGRSQNTSANYEQVISPSFLQVMVYQVI